MARLFVACLFSIGPAAWGDAATRPAAATATRAGDWVEKAYRLKAANQLDEALAAFAAARAAGADAQRTALERGYILAARNQDEAARPELETAAAGADPELAAAARRELAALGRPAVTVASAGATATAKSPSTALVAKQVARPRRFYFDIYADAFWSRTSQLGSGNDLVPTLRARALYRPTRSADFNLYLFAQATRDTASSGGGANELPQIYADNYALFGAGALLRFWRSRFGVFAQLGPAISELGTVDALHPRIALDARAGVVFYAETLKCALAPVRRAAWSFTPCVDGYGEAVYTSRFENNVIAFAHPRVAATYLRTGPVAWQLQLSGRVAKDINGNFYNNFVDAGPGLRWRLLAPFRLDLTASGNGGTYFGIARADEPAPKPLHYMDFRLEAATYVEF